MNTVFRALLGLVLSLASAAALAQADFSEMRVLTPGEIKFSAPAATAGIVSAVLFGNPKGPGVFVTRVKIPPHFKVQPHSHPDNSRTITVISGTYYFAYGDTLDETKLKALGPGSVYTEPKDLPHFAVTRDEEVVLQIVAEGPTGTSPVRK